MTVVARASRDCIICCGEEWKVPSVPGIVDDDDDVGDDDNDEVTVCAGKASV